MVYGKGRRLYAQPFDPASLAATGPAVAVLDDIRTSPTAGYAQAAVSNAGTLAYVTELLGNPPRELIWLDRSGHVLQAVGERRRYLSVSLSPDDAHAALTIQGDSQDLWVLSLARGTLSRMTSGDATEFDPTWSPRGAELFYVMDRPQFDLHRIGLGRTDSGRPLWHDRVEVDTLGPAVSHDGRMATRLRRLVAIGAV